MISRVRRGVAAISVASLLGVAFARQVNAIILSNDVDLASSNFDGFHDCVSKERNCQVIGAPRLIEAAAAGFDVDQLDQLQITIETQGAIPPPEWVALNVFLYSSLSPAPGPHGPLRLILQDPSGPTGTFGLKDFEGFDDLKTFIKTVHRDLIFTVAASFRSQHQLNPTDIATITLSGFGQWVAVDLLGVVADPPSTNAVVVPPRSMDLALALVRMGLQSENRPVDLGVDGTNRPVGFTHIVGLPSQARLQGATLRFLLTPSGPFFTTDYILFDEGVNKVAAGEEGAPVVALSMFPYPR